jgi:hypothetical protein
VERYVRLEALKRKGEAAIAEAKKRGEKPPALYPHPDDILLDSVQSMAYVFGPESPEEMPRFRKGALCRDIFLARYAKSHNKNISEMTTEEQYTVGMLLFLAQEVNESLPPSMQYSENDQIDFVMDWSGLSEKKFTKRFTALLLDFRSMPPDPQTVLEERRKKNAFLGVLSDSIMGAANQLLKEENEMPLDL